MAYVIAEPCIGTKDLSCVRCAPSTRASLKTNSPTSGRSTSGSTPTTTSAGSQSPGLIGS
jgi:hypothetical protein